MPYMGTNHSYFLKETCGLERETLIYGRESGHNKFCFKQLTPLFLFFLQGPKEGYPIISYNTTQISVAGMVWKPEDQLGIMGEDMSLEARWWFGQQEFGEIQHLPTR